MALWNGVIVPQEEFHGQELLLAECGIKKITPLRMADFVTALEEAREACYAFKAELGDAPKCFNCLTFMAWMFGRLGLTVTPLLEVATCGEDITCGNLLLGDLVFTRGIREWYFDPVYGGIGHVGVFTEAGILHATRSNGGEVNGVIEEPLEEFFEHTGPFRAARRLVARPPHITLACGAEAWVRDPPQKAEEVKKYIDRSRAWFEAQLVDA